MKLDYIAILVNHSGITLWSINIKLEKIATGGLKNCILGGNEVASEGFDQTEIPCVALEEGNACAKLKKLIIQLSSIGIGSGSGYLWTHALWTANFCQVSQDSYIEFM